MTGFGYNIHGFGSPGSAGGVSGQDAYTSGTSHTWTCPEGVESVSIVCIGGGGGGVRLGAGGGGELRYLNNFTVVAGEDYAVEVGAAGSGATGVSQNGGRGGASSFSETDDGDAVCKAIGGQTHNGLSSHGDKGLGGGEATYNSGGVGTQGGVGGEGDGNVCAGAGGAAGYSGNGGDGGYGAGEDGLGGGGGGGGSGNEAAVCTGDGGGGTGILGEGDDGEGGIGYYNAGNSCSGLTPGEGGSGGADGTGHSAYHGGDGGAYGGGGAGSTHSGAPSYTYGNGGSGGIGAVRIIYPGDTREFPSTSTGDA